ncbi:glycosyltransferase involved in cell wall biosynthesis [Micromonospora palomenae]|uniref:Glycosyltransferase involved in cell wall biosynthesis n=1 Tax=Micromonospora palomenae TaxID=1461247 RepID=A0A561VHV2_9ACTN|nr:glycosyltransferase [Micromonospora palomenae]TWG11177.1 glycosyltransferase involved in cell wall biosynthesis [Micromonospora palomenae]
MSHSAEGHSAAVNVLVLGTAEWDSPIATNQHYVVRELARAFDVTFVESLGLRRPKLEPRDLKRMAQRLHRSMSSVQRSARPRPENVRIVSPVVVPLHRAPTRPVNRALLHRSVSDWVNSSGPRVLWTFTPVTYGLEALAELTVYHCVDLLAEFPGIDGAAVRRGEEKLSSRAALAIGTSHAVADHLTKVGFPTVRLLTNVADTVVFESASLPAEQRRPAALFAGNLSPHKLDFDVLKSLATALKGRGELLLAGPIAAGGGGYDRQVEELTSLGARYLGVLDLPALAEVAGQCTVGLIPYALNAYTQGVSPLKCYEYLASGMAVVSTPLPEVRKVADGNPHVSAVEPQEFLDRVLAALDPPTDSARLDRMVRARQGSWSERGQLLRDLLASLLTPSTRKLP